MRLKKVVCASILYTLEGLSVLSFLPVLAGFLGSAAGAATIGAVGAIGSAALGMASARSSAKSYQQGAQEANEMQYKIAKENREFERDTSYEMMGMQRDTAYEMMQKRHQWEVADLKAAGLNPILSAHSAPSMGSVGVGHVSADTPPMQNTQAQAIEAGKIQASSAQQLFQNVLAARQQINLNNLADAQVENTSAQTAFQRKAQEELVQKISARLPFAQREQMLASASQAREMAGYYHEMSGMIGKQKSQIEQEILESEARVELLRSQKVESDSRSYVNYADRLIRDESLKLEKARVISEELSQIEKLFSIAGLEAGLPVKQARGQVGAAAKDVTEKVREGFSYIWGILNGDIDLSPPPEPVVETQPNRSRQRHWHDERNDIW